MASDITNIKWIEAHFDKHAKFVISKIRESNISLSKKSTSNVSDLVYPIVNLIDFWLDGSDTFLANKTIDEIHLIYSEQYKLNKEKFTTFSYIETNEVIIDYRKNELGYYWVDLDCYYSAEMLFRLNNCGRVNSYQNFLELREYDDTNFNNSKVAIVISNSGFINQIRGDYNTKPDMIYRNFIYDLLLNYKKLKGFNFLFGKEIDFTHLDLTKEQLYNLKRIRPELFSLI
jgi:hypothetical protein